MRIFSPKTREMNWMYNIEINISLNIKVMKNRHISVKRLQEKWVSRFRRRRRRRRRIAPVKKILSHFCSSKIVVSWGPPSITRMAFGSRQRGRSLANTFEVAGETSDGFNSTAFPAEMAPMRGSNANTVHYCCHINITSLFFHEIDKEVNELFTLIILYNL